jgi:Flp pilus assembly protein TadG
MRFIFNRRARLSGAIRQDTGHSLVETALVLPLLITIVVGAAEMARVAYAAIQVSNAARAGVQYGAQNGYTASDTAGIANAATNDAANLTTLTATSSFTCVCSDGTASTCSNGDCATSHIEQILTVNTQATINPVVHLPGLPKTYTLKGRAVQKCVQ